MKAEKLKIVLDDAARVLKKAANEIMVMVKAQMCPRYKDGHRCKGILNRESGSFTYMGTINGVDSNIISERFRCNICGVLVYRSWKWEEVK